MCRNIKTLFNFEPPRDRRRDSRLGGLQFVRESSRGFTHPSRGQPGGVRPAVDEVETGRPRESCSTSLRDERAADVDRDDRAEREARRQRVKVDDYCGLTE